MKIPRKKNILYHEKRIANIKMKLDFYENDVKIEKNETNPLTFWRRRVAFFSRVYQLNIFVIHPFFVLFPPFFSKFRARHVQMSRDMPYLFLLLAKLDFRKKMLFKLPRFTFKTHKSINCRNYSKLFDNKAFFIHTLLFMK